MMSRAVLLTCLCCVSQLGNAVEPEQRAVDRSSLHGKVMCGYQGWFNAPNDGMDLGWKHWARQRGRTLGPGNVTVDLWPDLTEYGAKERHATGFRHADGRVAEVFSSANRDTVVRHFKWMEDYGIDGAFVQRFVVGHKSPAQLKHQNQVLAHAKRGSEKHGRAYAVMYDLSGLKGGEVSRARKDWAALEANGQLASKAYLHHRGSPVVAIWGVGFSDGRDYSLEECHDLVRWFKSRNCTVMLGVPSFWREGIRDATDDKLLHQIIRDADIVSPWSVGRYRNPNQAESHAKHVWRSDQQWCDQNGVEFLPVAFPGFSWHNMKPNESLDSIPRLKGEFLWSQVEGAKSAGAKMLYVAMFDEVDEGTAIFKCTNDPPSGEDVHFLTYDGLPPDHYLKLVGKAGRRLRGEE